MEKTKSPVDIFYDLVMKKMESREAGIFVIEFDCSG
jgi:hypothetical protein